MDAWKVVAVPLLILGVGCGSDGAPPQCESADHSGPFLVFVSELATKPVPEQHRAVLAEVHRLPSGKGSRLDETVEELIRQLLTQCHLSTIEWLESTLRVEGESVGEVRDKLDVIYFSLERRFDQPAVRQLLQRLARAHPKDLYLAPYREGGMEYLMGVLGDKGAAPADRANSAIRIRTWGTVAMLEQLVPLCCDDTHYSDGFGGPPFGDTAPEDRDTIGWYVRQAVKYIARRQMVDR